MTTALAAGLTLAVAVAVLGVVWRCARWARAPVRLRVVLTPAPRGRVGTALRVLRELVLFDSLWRATRLGWLLGWSFHVALLLVLVDHLWLFVETSRAWSTRLHAVSVPVGIVLLVALAGLAARRVIDARVRYVSAPSDHLHLALLGAIAATGLAMRTVAPVDLGAALAFTRGIAAGEWSSTTLDPVLVAHVTGALVLLMVFPFSKLMHAPGVLFSPTIARRDDARQLR